MGWFKIRKGGWKGYILLLCLFNFYAEYIMQNARLDESQAGIKISRRNSNNLRYADDATLMTESEEEKNLLMGMKEESEKAGLKLNIQKPKHGMLQSMGSQIWTLLSGWTELCFIQPGISHDVLCIEVK